MLLDAGGGGGTGTSGIFPPVVAAVVDDVAVAAWEDNAGPEPDILILYRGISSAPFEPLHLTSFLRKQAGAQAIL